MKVKFDEREYDFDLDEIDVDSACVIMDKTGLTLMGLQEGLNQGNPYALRAVYWLMLKNSGVKAPDMNRTNFKIVQFANAVQEAVEAEEAEKAKAEEANPTPADESAPEPAE